VRGSILAQPGEWLADLSLASLSSSATFPYGQQLLESAPWMWRRRYGGITAYLTASALVDQGTVYAASFPTRCVEAFTQVGLISNVGSAPLGVATIHTAQRVNVAMDENSMQLMVPKPYVAPARVGAYIPQRFLGDDFSFVSPKYMTSNVMWDGNVNLWVGQGLTATPGYTDATIPVLARACSGYKSALGSYTPSWVASVQALQAGQGLPATSFPICDTGTSPSSTTVIIFRGLAPGASVTVRTMYGLEVVPRADSSQRQFAVPPLPGCRAALDLYSAAAAEMDMVYPAAYNALGLLAGVVGNLLRTIAPTVLPLVASALPERVRNVARAVGAAVVPALSEVQRVSVSDPRPTVNLAAPAVAVRKRGRQRVRKLKPAVRVRSVSTRRSSVTPRRVRR